MKSFVEVKIAVHDKNMRLKDYRLYNKNGVTLYFQEFTRVWELAYGSLADNIKEAFIEALILRYDSDVPALFYHQGKSQIVEVRAKKYSL